MIVLCRTSNPAAATCSFSRSMGPQGREKALPAHRARTVSTGGTPMATARWWWVPPTQDELAGRARASSATCRSGAGHRRAQGGDIEATVKAGRDSRGAGLIINSGRAILYASGGEDFAAAARGGGDAGCDQCASRAWLTQRIQSGVTAYQSAISQRRGERHDDTNPETATLGGGCFWCVEAVFDDLKGVHSVESGYMGGRGANPSYEEVCGGDTGHAERSCR